MESELQPLINCQHFPKIDQQTLMHMLRPKKIDQFENSSIYALCNNAILIYKYLNSTNFSESFLLLHTETKTCGGRKTENFVVGGRIELEAN